MKYSRVTNYGRVLLTGVMALGFALVPAVSSAKDKDKGKDKHKDKKHDRDHYEDHDHDRDRYTYHGKKRKYTTSYYRQVPRSSFSFVFGNGYSGPGYYYGPQDADYFYEAPGVSYYRTIETIPRRYEGSSRVSLEVTVQRSLARRGYYRGPIDGDLGPMSRRAIARFQQDEGLRPTGSLSRSTLEALGIRG